MRLTMHGCYRAVDKVSLVSNVADGSKADKPPQAKFHFCPLLSNSEQNVAVRSALKR
jgi:hypothetical protein